MYIFVSFCTDCLFALDFFALMIFAPWLLMHLSWGGDRDSGVNSVPLLPWFSAQLFLCVLNQLLHFFFKVKNLILCETLNWTTFVV